MTPKAHKPSPPKVPRRAPHRAPLPRLSRRRRAAPLPRTARRCSRRSTSSRPTTSASRSSCANMMRLPVRLGKLAPWPGRLNDRETSPGPSPHRFLGERLRKLFWRGGRVRDTMKMTRCHCTLVSLTRASGRCGASDHQPALCAVSGRTGRELITAAQQAMPNVQPCAAST